MRHFDPLRYIHLGTKTNGHIIGDVISSDGNHSGMNRSAFFINDKIGCAAADIHQHYA